MLSALPAATGIDEEDDEASGQGDGHRGRGNADARRPIRRRQMGPVPAGARHLLPIMRDYGRRFVKLGEIADIRFGIKSGCDAFFMPRDVTEEVLREVREGLPWNTSGL